MILKAYKNIKILGETESYTSFSQFSESRAQESKVNELEDQISSLKKECESKNREIANLQKIKHSKV